MSKRIPPKRPGRGANGGSGRPNRPPPSQAQRKRDRKQVGVAESHAREAEQLFPALRAGVLNPDQLVLQARYVLERAGLQTERHAEGPISKEHTAHMIACVRRFAQALNQVGVRVKVLSLVRITQSHYLDVMRLWEKSPPGEARRVNWILCHVRRLLVTIGRQDVIPAGARNKELLRAHDIARGDDSSFLINTYFDWASEGVDVAIIFQAIPDLGKRVAAKMMYYWGMSLLQVARWQAVDPDRCSFLHLDGVNDHRRSREVEFSRDRDFAARQMAAIKEAWAYCQQHNRPAISPPGVPEERFAERLRLSIRNAMKKQFRGQELSRLTPMDLCHGFFCQVFRDHAGISLQKAMRNPRLAQKDRRLARAWNEAKLQSGVQGAKAPRAHKGMSFSRSQSFSIARNLRSVSLQFVKLGVGDMWVGDVDASSGKCLFVRLLKGAGASALPRLQELVEQAVIVKLRVVRVLRARDVPEGAAPVMVRSVPA